MKPPPGSTALPGTRPAVLHGGTHSWLTGGWTTMRRRAGTALAAALVLSAVGAAAALGAPAATAATAAATSQQDGQSPVSVAITGMTPQEAVAGSVITVTGKVTNTSARPVSHLSVELLSSATPITSQTYLQPGPAELAGLADSAVPGATARIGGQIPPRATASWSIQFKASKIGMSVFGVYPIAAQLVDTDLQLPVISPPTYLPYSPPSKGPFGFSVPAKVKISWVWPLISTPLLTEPGQTECLGAQSQALVTSLASGRLGQLLTAAATAARTTDTAGTRPGQSLAGYDGVTWAVDPALLANVESLAGCRASRPRWAKAAAAWLAKLRSVSAGEPMFATPYADPNAGSLISAGHSQDVYEAFELGRAEARSILGRDLNPTASSAAAIDWPPEGTTNYATLEALAGREGVRTALLSSSALPPGSPTVTRYLNGGYVNKGYVDLVLANQWLTQLLGSNARTRTSAFATGQQFLAQTALLAQQDPGQPIVVAPPQRWGAASGVAADLLADTASASWLRPASLTSLTVGKKLQVTPNNQLRVRRHALSQREDSLLARVDSYVAQIEALRTSNDENLDAAVATDESSAWRGKARSQALGQMSKLVSQLRAQEQDVEIVAEKRVTLGGLKGSVPVSIANHLSYPVEVKLSVSGAPNGFRVSPSPAGLIRIPAHDAQTVRLHVTAAAVGSNTVVLSLENRFGQPLRADPALMTIQATQVGVLGAIICAIALGIALIAYAARAVRRGRPAGAQPADPQPGDEGGAARGDDGGAARGDDGAVDESAARSDDSGADESAAQAEPDTVMAERRELGAAGTPRP